MKKTYIKPDFFVEECMVEQIISSSGGDIGGTGSGGNISQEPAVPAAKKHSGLWNDVWGDE